MSHQQPSEEYGRVMEYRQDKQRQPGTNEPLNKGTMAPSRPFFLGVKPTRPVSKQGDAKVRIGH
jgi:hypothetical protein